jgi:microsomal dipeptidase-like Zn-dependent dipeptidase
MAALSAAITVAGGLFAAVSSGGVTHPARALDRYSLANHCFTLRVRHRQGYVVRTGNGYAAGGTSRAAAAFYLKPTRLGAYMLYDSGRGLLAAGSSGRVLRLPHPFPAEEWSVWLTGGGFRIRSVTAARHLAATRGGKLILEKPGSTAFSRFRFSPAAGCTPYPEASAGASGRPFIGTRPDGTVRGFVDAHVHITADLRAGGRVIDGRPFARFGITRALGRDVKNHGPDGSLDVTGNLLRTGLPFGTHDTHGWPTFAGWPVSDTNTHEQTYYAWLERAWMAGERLVVAQTVEDQPLCRIEPLKRHNCDETDTIIREVHELRDLQGYVDAQRGGPGRGWFRLVRSPAQARRVIERGKLAVVIGVESSDPFDCSEFKGKSTCTRADVDRGIALYRRLGIRGMFIAHWVNNAFAGAALEGGSKGAFIGLFNVLETGEYFQTGKCPSPKQGETVVPLTHGEQQVLAHYFPKAAPVLNVPIPVYPAGRRCNSRGLTKLGRYLVRRLIAKHMLIEVDHLSEKAREQVLKMAAKRHYPVVSSHNGTGGLWTGKELRTLYANGGYASVTPDQAPQLAKSILRMRRFRDPRHYFGVGLGSDTGGFSSLPGPRADAGTHPLTYPFTLAGSRFRPQRTGKRTFNLNTDGVAHYGLFADVLGDMKQNAPDGRQALRLFYRSAEAYLETWQRAVDHR